MSIKWGELHILYVGFDGINSDLFILKEFGAKITTIEKDFKKLNLLSNFDKNIILKEGNLLKLPFKNNYFDVCILSHILHEIYPKDHKQGIKEAKRVSKMVIIVEPVPRSGKINKKFEILYEKALSKQGIIEKFKRPLYWINLINDQVSHFFIKTKAIVSLPQTFIKNQLSFFTENGMEKKGINIIRQLKKTGLELQSKIIIIWKKGKSI